MKAILCTEHGPPSKLTVADVPPLRADPGRIVVTVKACGVAFPDTLIIQGKYQFQPDLPFSPGGEVAGIVKEIGDGVEGISPGDQVIAFTGWGGYAEEVVATPEQIAPMPEGMDFATASGFVMNYGTSYHALKDRAQLRPGERLLVLGAAGGVGLTAVELGALMGARVIAAASSDEKLEVCRRYGASETINYAKDDVRARLKEIAPEGVDVVYDPVGGEYAEPAVRAMAWEGRYLVVGFAAGDIPRIPLNLVLLKGCQLVGVFWGAFARREPKRNADALGELLRFWSEGKIKPYVSATYPFERAPEALQDMIDRKVAGKVVLVADR